MNWYYTLRGTHVHVRVFMNGGLCGNLVFRKDEFEELKSKAIRSSPSSPIYAFIAEGEVETVNA